MSKPIAVDLDGCVTNFTRGFSALCNSIDPMAPIIYDNNVPEWTWQNWYYDAGPKAKKVIDAAWREIKDYPSDFWASLYPLFPETMKQLAHMATDQPLIFITRRDGPQAWNQTVHWLRMHDIDEPLVWRVKSGEEKSEVMDKLGLDVIIEDSPKYVMDDLLPAGKRIVLIDWCYNRVVPKADNIIRVANLAVALDIAKEFYSD